ncbi:MAG: hypothetical protein K5622_01715 [Endomicrobiaceae bacterium]|nr:hypothetical protein [Endomicrobiaceae bacterium]
MNKNNRVLIFIINLLFFLGLAYVCYNYIYLKYANVRDERRGVYEKFHNISKQLDDFVNIQTSMDEQKNSIMEPLSIYEDTFYSNEQNKTAYKVRILDLLKSLDIPTKDGAITQEQRDDNLFVTVTINTDYERVCKFLFELERYSNIKTIDMDYKGDFVIVTTPILFDEQINDCFSGRSSIDSIDDDIRKSGYFREIYDKIMEVKDVGDIPSWREFQPIPKNPFYYYVPPKAAGTGGAKRVVNYGKPDRIVIDGIMYEAHKPIVIIEGKFYYVGNTYKNCKIVQINENNIKVNYYGKIYTIGMEN